MMTAPLTSPASARLLRIAIWVAIGALIAAALVCVVWVLFGPEDGIVGRAFLTILLLAAFAGVAILDANLAGRRPAWFALASMTVWVVLLLIGAFMIWMPEQPFAYGMGFERFFRFLVIVLVLQLALLHIRLFAKAHARYATSFTTIVTYVTMGFVVVLAIMLVVPLVFSEYFEFQAIYWRIVVAIAILAAVGTALVPLVGVLLAPKRPRSDAHLQGQAAYAGYPGKPAQLAVAAAPQWPTYVDGFTPLPVMPDGSPDWNAYYTGYPTYPQHQGYAAPVAAATAHVAAQAYPAPYYPAPAASVTDSAESTQPSARIQEQVPTSQTAPPVYDPNAPATPAPPAAPAGYDGFPPPPPLPPRP